MDTWKVKLNDLDSPVERTNSEEGEEEENVELTSMNFILRDNLLDVKLSESWSIIRFHSSFLVLGLNEIQFIMKLPMTGS